MTGTGSTEPAVKEKRRLCLTFHTERLHDDRVWSHVHDLAAFFHRRGVTATWFSVAPVQPAYRAQGFDAEKWVSRVCELAGYGQTIEQHSHFYGTGKGPYDLSADNVEHRLTEDRAWLVGQGLDVQGFVAGGWAIDRTILGLLVRLGFTYDCSLRNAADSADGLRQERPGRIETGEGSLVEVPTTSGITLRQAVRPAGVSPVLYLHDYDLLSWYVRVIVKKLVWLHGNHAFVSTRDIAAGLLAKAEG